jgi:predicted metal-dependent enzyme (double-stranded beta helix superfamily)
VQTSSFQRLIADVRTTLASGLRDQAAGQVASVLEPYLSDLGLLEAESLQPDPERYRQYVLHVEPEGFFTIAALVWLPGQKTPIHDHISWCTVGVYQGCELEVQYALESTSVKSAPTATCSALRKAGEVQALTPGADVHEVANPGPGIAISLHIYGADLNEIGSSIRRSYQL